MLIFIDIMIKFLHEKTNYPKGFDLGRGATLGWPLLFEVNENANLKYRDDNPKEGWWYRGWIIPVRT